MELLPTRLTRLLRQLSVVVNDIHADGTFLDACEFLLDILLPQEYSVDNSVVTVVKLCL